MHKGFGSFVPYSDRLICPVCVTGFTIHTQSFYEVIKTIILFECKGVVKYEGNVNKNVESTINELKLISFDKSDGISSIEINVKENDITTMTRLDKEQFDREPTLFGDI